MPLVFRDSCAVADWACSALSGVASVLVSLFIGWASAIPALPIAVVGVGLRRLYLAFLLEPGELVLYLIVELCSLPPAVGAALANPDWLIKS